MDSLLPPGKKARLHELLYTFGPGNGKLLILPVDQGLEHGPRDFFSHPESLSPTYPLEIACEGRFSAIAFQIGLAEKYWAKYAGQIPLVLKINGKTSLPSDEEAFSPCNASVEDAVRIGANAVGYTLYVGSPAQDRDLTQLGSVRQKCERFGMPLIVWAYPRGKAVEAKGGKNSLYAIDYAARVACEVGADVVKINFPGPAPTPSAPAPYNTLKIDFSDAVKKVIQSAGRTRVIFSGGSQIPEEDLLKRAKIAVEAGGTGFIFGRNIWQRPKKEALALAAKLKAILRDTKH